MSLISALPGGVNFQIRFTDKVHEMGYSALVVEGMGGGHVHPAMAARLGALSKRMPVVVSTRVVGSHVLRSTYGFVGSEIDLSRRGLALGGWLTTGKLHLLLTFLLADGADQFRIRNAFTAFGGA
jgi:L-asparaginase